MSRVHFGVTLVLSSLLHAGCQPPAVAVDEPDVGAAEPDAESSPPEGQPAPSLEGAVPAEFPDDRVLPPDDWASPARRAHGDGPATLCLDFDGARIGPEESFIVAPGRATRIPPFDARPYGVHDRGEAIAQITAAVRAHFAFTGLRVTDACPPGGHTRIVIGGTPDLVGEDGGVAGIAPYDIGNVSDDDIGFAFAAVLGRGRGRADLARLAAVVSHEAGHTFGLDHVRAPADLMYPTVNDGMVGFGAAQTLDGHWQDAPTILSAALGPAPSPGGDESGATSGPFDCDPPEETSGPRRDRAAEVSAGVAAGGQICRGDEDWYAFEAREGETLDIELIYPDEGWVEPPALFRPRGRTPIGEASSEDGVHHLAARAEVSGRYRLQITTSDDQPWRYALRVHVKSPR